VLCVLCMSVHEACLHSLALPKLVALCVHVQALEGDAFDDEKEQIGFDAVELEQVCRCVWGPGTQEGVGLGSDCTGGAWLVDRVVCACGTANLPPPWPARQLRLLEGYDASGGSSSDNEDITVQLDFESIKKGKARLPAGASKSRGASGSGGAHGDVVVAVGRSTAGQTPGEVDTPRRKKRKGQSKRKAKEGRID
jgi:hypothetical protein